MTHPQPKETWPHRQWIIDFHAMKVLYTLPVPEEMHECIVRVMPIAEVEAILRQARAEVYEEAADTFRSCGETAVELAYRDKAKEMRGK